MAAKKAAGNSDAGKPMSKTEIYSTLAERTGLSKRDVSNVFDELGKLVESNLGKKGPRIFTVPGLMKITVQHKPATKERKGIDPFTKTEKVFKAKPARNVVKIRPLKGLKDMV